MSGWNSIRGALAAVCAALVLCALLTACKTPLERAYGVSQHAHTAQMIDDPEAGLRNREVAHPDGRSAGIATGKMRGQEAQVEEAKADDLISGTGSN